MFEGWQDIFPYRFHQQRKTELTVPTWQVQHTGIHTRKEVTVGSKT